MAALNTDSLLKGRTRQIAKSSQSGRCVLYVMSRDQRITNNHALLAAQKDALANNLPLGVVFCLKPGSGHRAREHYEWMLTGLRQIEASLDKLNIPFLLFIGDPFERLSGCFRHLQPRAVYFDMSPLRSVQNLQKKLARGGQSNMYVIDTHNIIPAWEASGKQEFSARTLRPKIHRQLSEYLILPNQLQKSSVSWQGPVMKMRELEDRIEAVLAALPSNGQHNITHRFPPGEAAARRKLADFINNRLEGYAEDRNDPTKDGLSGLSPYLHFGQLSSLEVVTAVTAAAAHDSSLQRGTDALVEEIVVRKELSDNYCYHNENYDRLTGAPSWALQTLAKHAADPREFVYSKEEFEQAKTHDPAWNAAQIELVTTGKMHGYMRMYWAKKVLEWSESPEKAVKILIYLNDFYSIDGGDPNGYVGILWSVAGLHDRPWGERPVYGTIRSMVFSGLKRKFDIDAYIKNNS